MSHTDEPDDEFGFVPPLPAEDRLWRHPSELRGASRPSTPAIPTEVGARVRHPAGRAGHRSSARTLVLASVALGILLVGVAVASRSFDEPAPTWASGAVRGASPVVDLRSNDGARRVRSAMVQLAVDTTAGPRSATGLVIDSSGHVLTTADALRDATSIEVIPVEGSTRRAQVLGVDSIDDIAVIATDPSGLSPAALMGPSDLASDSPIMVIGLSTDIEPLWARLGRLTASHVRVDTVDGQHFVDMLQVAVAGDPPTASIVCSRDGAIIGIVTDRITTTPTLRSGAIASSSIGPATSTVYATPVAWMRSVVAQLLASGATPRTGQSSTSSIRPTGSP